MKRRKHWRKFLVNNLMPARFQLVEFLPLINKITSIARGEEVKPLDIYRIFHRSLNSKLKELHIDQGNVPFLIEYSSNLPTLSKEDIGQQCFLYLIELWNFHASRWSKTRTVFYDFVRTNLPRWIGIYVSKEILRAYHPADEVVHPESVRGLPLAGYYEIEESSLKLDLNWVVSKHTNNLLEPLTAKQKYLVYLRYTKDLSSEEISNLTTQHRGKIDKEFALINKILHGERYDATWSHTKESS